MSDAPVGRAALASKEFSLCHWIAGPLSPVIGDHEVHIWKVDLAGKNAIEMDALLSPDERARAARFHFERDRQRFVVARGSLRTVLSRYSNLPAGALEFGQTEYGKPFLTNPAETDLSFNLSHSGNLALIAVTRRREVGVDIECMRDDFATDEIAAHFFSAEEVAQLRRVPLGLRTEAFFNCWTRKEAYIKARGEGLSRSLDSFDVSLAPGVPAALLRSRCDPSDVSRWNLHELFPAADYAAAIAIESGRSSLSFRYFDLAK
jgi:4'-phosphopantetheinyl transferase